jgi:hypothetical protein
MGCIHLENVPWLIFYIFYAKQQIDNGEFSTMDAINGVRIVLAVFGYY